MQLPRLLRSALFTLAVAFVALAAAPSMHADTVVLKNGDRLTGTAVKLDGGKLTFKTPYADAIVITWDQVTSLITTDALVLPTAKGNLAVTDIERSDTSLTVTTPSGLSTLPAVSVTVLRNAADQKTYEASLRPSWGHAWAGAANVSFALAHGNANTATFGAGLAAARTTRTDKTSLYVNSLYSENANATPSTSANNTGGGISYDHNLNPKLIVFTSGDFLADALQNLDLRSIVGGGFGWHASKTPRQTFDVTGGLVWTHENYAAFYTTTSTSTTVGDTTTTVTSQTLTPAEVNSFAALAVGEQYSRKIGAGSLFTEQANVYPDLNNLGQYQFNMTSTYSAKIAKMFNWVTTFSDNYTSFPPPGTLDNDIILTTGLGVTLTRK